MTLATETASVTYTGNGVLTAFNIPFKYLSTDDIQVTQITISTGAGTILSASQYSVSPAGEETGGTLTLSPAISSLYQIRIERVVALTQELDLEREGGFYPEDIEAALDRIVMMVQMVRAELEAATGGEITSITRNVAGPASSVVGNIPTFSNGTGTALADSGYDPSDFALENHTHAADWTEKDKAANFTKTSSTALTSDADLTFTMAANTTYVIEGRLFINSPSTSGMKVGLTGPSGGTVLFTGFDIDNTGTQAAFGGSSYSTNLRANTPALSEDVVLYFTARIANGANAGAFAVQFAQNTSNAAASTLYKGSYIRYKVM